MAQNVTQRFPFSNKGVVQKIDINQLQDGQYALLLNMVSEQEGSLSPRYGHTNLTGSWPSAVPSYVNSLHVTQVGATSNPTLYAAENDALYRKISTSGNYQLVVYNTVSTSAAHKRIGMSTYKTDQTGTTGMTYIATGENHYPGGGSDYIRGMFRDNGQAGTIAKYWGILPPAKPADITPSAMTITPIFASGAYNGTIVINGSRASGTITAVADQPVGSSFYKITFTPTSSAWLPGMYIVTGAQSSVIEKVDSAGAIYAYFASAPSVSASIVAYESATVPTTAGLTYTATSNAFSSPGLDLSFGATNDNEGYVTDDTIAFSFFTSSPENIYDIRLRFYTNSASSAYYEKAISPGLVQSLQNAVSSNATINPDSPGMVADENGASNAVTDPVIPTGNVITYDVTQVGLNPAYLTPSKAGFGGWSQVEISKRSFLALGNAGTVDDGSGGQGWKTIYGVEVIIRPTTTTAVVNFKLGSIFAYGGKGVNSNYGAKLTPYSYVYTYKSKITGAESNPCIEMVPENTLNIVRQGINVNVLGTEMAGYQSLNAEVDTICIYRSGGTFADGLYRRVGVINNPGAAAGNFVDTADDLSIVGAPIAEFDNDAPVTSDIGQEYKFNLAATYPKGAATISLSTISSTMRNLLTPGTIVNIGGGIAGATGKQESCVVLAVNTGSFTTYLQYDHLAGEAVIWDTNAGVACDVLCSAFNRMWVAGDAKNPHVLYSSKTGKPESFPIINQGTGNPHAIAVSSPDNPINGIAEFNGELVCLCQNGIYTIRLDNGRMVGPFKTPANRGLVLKYAWGYVDNEIWFLSNDGIYAWAGAGIRKVTFAIDFVFNKKSVNGIAPFDRLNTQYYPLCNIQQKNNEIFFNYINTDGWFFVLRYHLLFDRWSVDEIYDPSQLVYQGNVSDRNGIPLRPVAITAMVSDRAAGVLYASKTVGSGSWPTPTYQAALIKYDDVNTYTDNAGSISPLPEPIYYETKTKFYDMGTALAQKNFTDIGFEFTSGLSNDADNTFFYKVYYDYLTTAGDSSASIPNTATRQISQFPLQQAGYPLASEGKEARAAMFSLYGKSKAYNIFHNFSYTFIPLSDTIKGRVTDWDDLGHPFDKRLFNVTIEYDNGNTELVLYLDTVSGLNSSATTLVAQTIILPAKSGRAKSSIAITADIIAKMVRLRPKVALVSYQIFNYSFQKEDYPRDVMNNTDWSDLGYQYEKRLYQLYINCDTGGANVSVAIEADGGTVLQTVTVSGSSTNRMQAIPLDKDLIGKLIRLKVTSSLVNVKFQLFDYKFDFENLPKPIVLSTPPNDFGYDYLKYAEQVSFDINTSGYNVPVSLYGDGVLMQTVTVNGTQTDRNQIITLSPALTFRTMRLEVGAIPAGGRFQLWDYRPIFKPADKGEVFHTFDWDDIQYPYDKKLTEITIEFQTNTGNVQIAIDTLSGIDGNTRVEPFQTLTLPNSSNNRGFKTFPINETVCKMIRVRAIGPTPLPSDFKMYGYKVGNVVQYPADIVNFTDWSDLGYQYEKRLYQLYINCDTAGQNVTVNIEADGGIVQQVNVNGTATNRMQPIPINNDIIGKLIRLSVVSVPGGGKFQLFDYKFDFENLPKPIVLSTPWNDFGYDYLKYAEQISFDVNTNNQPVPVSLYGDGTLMQTITVTGTQANRNQIITLNPALTFRTMRLEVGAVPGGGRFQLWDYRPIFKPADKGEVFHTFDWDDLQYPYDKKLTEISIEFQTNTGNVQVAIDTLGGIDGNTRVEPFQTLTLPNSSNSRGFKTFPINETVCKMIRVRAVGPTPLPTDFKMYGYKVGNAVQYPADTVLFTDWSDLGYQYEKRLYQLYINCDTNNTNVTVDIEADGGTLLQTVTVNGTATNRMQPIPIAKDKIGKLIRLRVTGIPGGGKFQLFDYKFDFENLPKPIVLSTPWNDFGYDYLKYAEQISFDVNTEGIAAPVNIYGDGVFMQTVSVTGTQADRNQIITLNPALTFRTMRLEVGTLLAGGRFQLWDYRPIFKPADKGEVFHTFDWDDLQYPYDKKLTEISIEFETGAADNVQIAIDTLSGIDGTTQSLAFQTLTLPNTSGVRGLKTFAINETVCKLVRIRAIGSGSPTTSVLPASFKMYGYKMGNVSQYPADIVKFTDWSDLGYQYEKRIYQLYVNCDTAGQNVVVNVEADGAVLQQVTVNGTSTNRMQPIPINNDIIGKLIRLSVVSIPGGGKFQLFDHKFDFENLPKPIVLSTPWNDFGYDYLKYAEQISFDVNTNNQIVPVSIYGDGTLMQTINVTGTQANRNQIITLNPALTFRTMRLEVGVVPGGGRFQLWDYRPIFKPADKGEVFHTFDWDDVQYPYDKKLTEITIEFETGASDDVKIALDTLSGLDGTTLTSAFQTLTLPNTSGSRGFKTFAINETICKMVRIRAIGSGSPTTSVLPASFKMYGYKFGNVTQYPPDIVFFTDWSDLGYQYEKRFYQLFMNCDTNGFDVTVNIEADGDSFGISSIASQGAYVRVNTSASHFLANGDKVYIKGVTGSGAANVNGTWIVTVISATAFMLNDSTFTGSPTGGTAYKILQQVVANATTTNRMLTFAMDKDLIGKLVRLNVVNIPAGGKFQLFDQKFDFENLPKPIVLSTPWSDFGYDYMKHAEQIAFDINTNGVQIPVDIYCDGVWKQRVVVEGTQQSRNFNCTLNPAITFQTMRLQINPDQIPSGGRFQLWEYKPVFRPADKGEVNHTFDWDNLEHPYDKKISEVTIEFETNGKNVAIALDTLTGIDGNTENLAVQTFTLNSTGRGYKTFPINETICKMVRIRAVSTAGRNNRLDPDFKMYGYKFGNTAPYPPDIQKFSEWADLDYPCDKIFRGVGLTIDTGGVNCTVTLEVDGVASQTFTVNTTSASRQTFLTAQTNTEIIGKLYRLTFTPGAGGKAQVFGAPAFNTVKDSCPFVFLDSYEQGLGSVGYSVLKQFWADYKCVGSITVKFYNEQNVLFYSKTLGPHTSRDVDRFYLPTINGSVINKSKKHRVTIEAVDPTKPFKWYRDASRLEYINLSADQRQGYYQFIPWTNMQLPV